MYFNLIGFAMFVVAAAVAEGIVRVVGSSNRHVQILIAGLLFTILDVVVRSWRGTRPFGRGGGAIMFLPVWLWGLVLAAIESVSLVRGT